MLTPARYVLTLEDSEVSAIQLATGRCTVQFSAIAAVEISLDGASTAGYALGVQLLLEGAALHSGELTALGRLRRGDITVDGQLVQQLVPGGDWLGRVELLLVFANGATCVLLGARLACAFMPAPRFVESYAC